MFSKFAVEDMRSFYSLNPEIRGLDPNASPYAIEMTDEIRIALGVVCVAALILFVLILTFIVRSFLVQSAILSMNKNLQKLVDNIEDQSSISPKTAPEATETTSVKLPTDDNKGI